MVWKLKLKHPQQAVLLAMADHSNDEGGDVYPSAGLIGWKCGYSKRQVQRIIDGMEASGLLELVAEAHGWRPTEYRICFEVAEAKAPYKPSKKGRGAKVSPQDPGATGRQDDAPPSSASKSGMSPPGATSTSDRGAIQVSPRTLEPSKEPPSGEDQPTAALLRDELVGLSNRLADRIRANDSKATLAPESEGWLKPLRLLVDRDGRSVEEVERVIDWCQNDEFWRSNILSPRKLREKFTQLTLHMSRSGPAGARRESPSDLLNAMGAAA